MTERGFLYGSGEEYLTKKKKYCIINHCKAGLRAYKNADKQGYLGKEKLKVIKIQIKNYTFGKGEKQIV